MTRRLALLLLALTLALGSFSFARHASSALRSPWSPDYGEGCTLALGALLAAHGSYFPVLVDYPFLVANYPPVFPALVAIGQELLGPTLVFPRLLATTATLALLLLLYATLRHVMDAAAPALALTLLFLMPWFVTTWAALARVDTLALALSLGGLLIVLRRGPVPAAWPALVLFWLAFFTKQRVLAAPAAVRLEPFGVQQLAEAGLFDPARPRPRLQRAASRWWWRSAACGTSRDLARVSSARTSPW